MNKVAHYFVATLSTIVVNHLHHCNVISNDLGTKFIRNNVSHLLQTLCRSYMLLLCRPTLRLFDVLAYHYSEAPTINHSLWMRPSSMKVRRK